MSKLLDEILSKENMTKAYKSVCANKGSAGIDGISTDDIQAYVNGHWDDIKSQIRTRSYRPQPVKRVEIPKPSGGKRKLGIPTVMDRIIQQAIVQKLTTICEPYFSESSYGFRPGRSCEMAIVKVLEYVNDGYEWIVDIDLEKFFDNVPQDKLMSYVHVIINDGDTESLIRRYLQAGVMNKGRYEETKLGTPQGGNLSPLLSNIMLNQLDKELEARGLRFTRYADDCVILVKSGAAAKRVMYSITDFIERKLGLKVNMTKTRITRPNKLKYLGFGFWKDKGEWKARPHEDSVMKFKRTLKKLCKRNIPMSMDERIQKLNWVIRGWVNYFAIGNMKSVMSRTDSHLRTMIRIIIWKQWKTAQKRRWGLLKLGCPEWIANKISQWGNHYFFVATRSGISRVITKEILIKRGLLSCLDYYNERHSLKFS
jgi:group II intron reverse transcriptase/maturase